MDDTGQLACTLRLDDIPDGQSRGVDAHGRGRDTVILVRQGQRLHAWEDRCPHFGDTPMAWRKDAYLSGDRRHIVCAAHGARFEIETGVCVLGPCLGRSLTPVTATVDGQGRIRLQSTPDQNTTTTTAPDDRREAGDTP